MPKSRRRVRKPARAPSALWRTQQALLDAWIRDSPQGQQLLRERTLEEARTTVLDLLADGLLEMRLVDVPNGPAIEVVPTALALAGGADASQASAP
jgi:hypothetical protein